MVACEPWAQLLGLLSEARKIIVMHLWNVATFLIHGSSYDTSSKKDRVPNVLFPSDFA